VDEPNLEKEFPQLRPQRWRAAGCSCKSGPLSDAVTDRDPRHPNGATIESCRSKEPVTCRADEDLDAALDRMAAAGCRREFCASDIAPAPAARKQRWKSPPGISRPSAGDM